MLYDLISAQFDNELNYNEQLKIQKHILKSTIYKDFYDKTYFDFYKISKSLKKTKAIFNHQI